MKYQFYRADQLIKLKDKFVVLALQIVWGTWNLSLTFSSGFILELTPNMQNKHALSIWSKDPFDYPKTKCVAEPQESRWETWFKLNKLLGWLTWKFWFQYKVTLYILCAFLDFNLIRTRSVQRMKFSPFQSNCPRRAIVLSLDGFKVNKIFNINFLTTKKRIFTLWLFRKDVFFKRL